MLLVAMLSKALATLRVKSKLASPAPPLLTGMDVLNAQGVLLVAMTTAP